MVLCPYCDKEIVGVDDHECPAIEAYYARVKNTTNIKNQINDPLTEIEKVGLKKMMSINKEFLETYGRWIDA